MPSRVLANFRFKGPAVENGSWIAVLKQCSRHTSATGPEGVSTIVNFSLTPATVGCDLCAVQASWFMV